MHFKRYPAEQWILIRATYESESAHNESLADVIERLRKTHPEYKTWPPAMSAKCRRVKEMWVKGKLSPQVERSIQQQAVEDCATYGLTKLVAAEALAQGVLYKQTALKSFEEGVSQALQSMGEAGPDSNTVQALKAVVDRFLTDMGLPLRYLQEYHKIAGLYAPVKVEKTVTDNTGNQALRNLSRDDLRHMIDRDIKKYLMRKKIKAGLM